MVTDVPAAATERPRRRARPWILVLAGLALLLGMDLARPPRRQLATRALLASIHLYQRTLSPLMPRLGVHCRFTPTCSHYGEAVVARDGALVGSLEAAWRVLRCGPWTPAGTVDPP